MRALITTFLALFIWTMVPVDALADRGGRQNERNSYSSRYENGRHDHRHHDQRRHHDSYHDNDRWRHDRHTRPTPIVKRVIIPGYRVTPAPSAYLYTGTPGVTFYITW